MSTAAQPASAAKTNPKVLRLGLIKEGKVSERITKIGEIVSVGENPRNLFVVTEPRLGQRVEMFIPQRDGYLLQVPEWVEGMIQTKDGMKAIADLRSSATKRGDLWVHTLDERMRGKLVIGTSSILFQFVPAPPQPERAMSAADFRAKWYDDEDPLFLVLLGSFSLVAASFMTFIYMSPRPDDSELTNVDDAVKLLDKDIEPLPIEIKMPKDEGNEKPEEEKPKEDKPKEDKPAADTDSAPPKDNQPPPSAESVAKKSLLIQALGTVGDATNGRTAVDILGDDSTRAGLDAALAGVTNVQEASAAGLAARGGSANGKENAGVAVSGSTGGEAGTGSAVAVKIKKPKIDFGGGDVDVDSGDGAGIPSIVKKKSGTFQSCVEAGLKQDEGLSGRIAVGWSIVSGVVKDAHVVENTTGNTTLGSCFVTGVRGLRFDAALNAEVPSYTWAVSGQ